MPDRSGWTRASRLRRGLVWLVLFGVLGLAIDLRFAGLGQPSLWLDEILHVEKTREAASEPWHAWLLGLKIDRENGPLYYATQLLAARVVDGETAARLAPALLGVSTVVVMAAVGGAVGGAPMAITACALAAVAPMGVYLSREGRPYSAMMLVAALLLLVLICAEARWTAPAGYGVCVLAAYYSALSAPLLVSFGLLAGCDVAGSWLRRRPHGFGVAGRPPRTFHFLLAAVVGLALLGLLYVRPLGEGRSQPVHSGVADGASALSGVAMDRLVAGLTISGVDWATATPRSGVFLALAILGVVSLSRQSSLRAKRAGGMCVLPIVVTLLYLSLTQRWFLVRYTAVALPALLLLVAAGLGRLATALSSLWPLRRVGGATAGTLVAISLTALLVSPGLEAARTEPYQKPDWRGLVGLIGELSVEGEPVLTAGIWPRLCVEHYVRALSLPLTVVNVGGADPDLARRVAAEAGTAWLVAAGYLRTDALRAWMRAADPIARSPVSEVEIFFYPDFPTFLSSRVAAGRAGPLQRALVERDGHRRVELGDSELMLGRGWSYPEVDDSGRRYRWASERVAELALPTLEGGGSRIRVGLHPFTYEGAEPQSVLLRLNGHPLGERQLGPDWQDFEVTAPAELWQPGANLLTLGFDRVTSPSDVIPGSQDARRLAAAVDRVELEPWESEGGREADDHGAGVTLR